METLLIIFFTIIVVGLYIALGALIGIELDDNERKIPGFMLLWPILLIIYAVKSLFNK